MSYQPLLVLLSLPAFWPLEMTACSVLVPVEHVFPSFQIGHSLNYAQWLSLQLMQTTSLTHALLSWSN